MTAPKKPKDKAPVSRRAPKKPVEKIPVPQAKAWKEHSTMGRKPIFSDADQLWSMCCEYFEWVTANPLEEEVLFHFKGSVTRATKYRMRAMTIGGLCIFLDIAHQTWLNYKAREEFLEVATRVEAIVRDQKFTGAAAELFNPNIIARDLGLKEHVDQTVDQTNHIDRDTRLALLKGLLNKGGADAGEEAPDIESGEVG